MRMQATSAKNMHARVRTCLWEEVGALGLVDFGHGLVQSDISH